MQSDDPRSTERRASASLPGVAALLDVMQRLRDPENGCPWDRAQTWPSIVSHTLEEAYELADAVQAAAGLFDAAAGPMAGAEMAAEEKAGRASGIDAVRGELGDLLFQVVFLARIAEERGWFDFDAVAAGMATKLIARHPHVFEESSQAAGGDTESVAAPDTQAGALGDAGSTQQAALGREAQWEAIKAGERATRGQLSPMDDVPLALPALARAGKLQKRASRVGFDWGDEGPVRDKVLEELHEWFDAQAEGPEREAEEFGDLLFALVNMGRHRKIDPEAALRGTNRKFERRFRAMEARAAADGREFAALDLEEQEGYYRAVKAAESAPPSA